jgi:threonine-phosphate decarboxylase
MMTHGANIYKYAKTLDCHPDAIIDFSSNVNLHKQESTLTLSKTVSANYADNEYREFKEFLAKKYALKSSQIALFNGATSAIHALLKSLKRDNVFLYEPLYSEYEKAIKKKNIYRINRISSINADVLEDSIVVFVNPSTPEGTYYNLEELLPRWMELNCTIILDESFLEFERLKSYRDEINNYKKLYIVQSFTKFYASAGVRVGAIFSHKKSIKKLETPLWSISSLDIEFLKLRLSDSAFIERSHTLHKEQKVELNAILEASGHFDEIVESDANFILTYSAKGEELFEHLLSHKILVRSCESFTYLSKNWLRFAVKDKASHQALKEALLAFA